MLFEIFNSLLSGLSIWVIAKKFLLSCPTVDIEQKRILIKRNLRWYDQVEVLLGERFALNFIFR